MSHNAVVHCLRQRTLVAFGGLAHAPDSADWQGNDVGIWRLAAPATLPPLAWSTPQLVLSGDPNTTGCVDAVREGPSCEYDGKLSVVRFGRSTLLFTRSNLARSGGARHVQVTRSADGVHGWERFEQLQIAGVAHGNPDVNIYFLSVRSLRPFPRAGGPRWTPRLLGLFPGVLGGAHGAGVFSITSADGVHWSAPRKLFASAVDGQRTRDHPVDGSVPRGWWLPAASREAAANLDLLPPGGGGRSALGTSVRIVMQTGVDLRAYQTPSMDKDCDASVGRPIFCSYILQVADIDPQELSISNRGASATSSRRRRHLARLVRASLHATYPAARPHIGSASDEDIIRIHAGLDYFVVSSLTSGPPLCRLLPRSHLCAHVPAFAPGDGSSSTPASLVPFSLPSAFSPYLPPGAYYVATDRATGRSANARPFMEASFTRHAAPVIEFAQPIWGQPLVSSWASKVGPAPSWTSPLAAVRYVLFPHGLRRPARWSTTAEEPTPPASSALWSSGARRDLSRHRGNSSRGDFIRGEARSSVDSEVVFEPRRHPRVIELFSLRDGDLVEVEQWGGWAAADCPPICGLWANVWRGTGLAMRVSTPLVSLSKATAVVDMLLALGDRSLTVLAELGRAINLLPPARTMLAAHPRTSLAVCMAAVLLMEHPCEAADAGEDLQRTMESWLAAARQAPPSELVAAFQALAGKEAAASMDGDFQDPKQHRLWQIVADGERRFGLYWLYGVCGLGGPFHRTGYGWDGLLALLACLLGHHTIVLAASANDNGLLHQEVVDFELPPPYGWPSLATATSAPNALHKCRRQFDLFQADKAQGAQAKQARRRELHSFWLNATRHGPKFVLPRRLEASVHGTRVLDTTVPIISRCALRFGSSTDEVAGALDACELAESDESSPPSAAKACWAWCDGTLSQVHAGASIFHVHNATAVEASHGVLLDVTTSETQDLRITAHREVSTSSPAVPQTPATRYSGYCNTVIFGGSCHSGTRGAWRAGIAGGMRSLSDCQRACLTCARCNFVSFSRASGVCAWYETCSMPLLHSAEGTAFVTTQVVRPPMQSPVEFHVHPLSQATAHARWEDARIASATRRFSRQNASELCHIVPRRRFGLPAAPDVLGPSQQLLGNCVPVLQVWPAMSSQDSNGAIHACCALCADTLGCTAWTLLRGGECCLRRWRPERTFAEKKATAGTVRSPCKVDCALHHRPFGRDGVRIPTASAAEIPWLAIGEPAPDASIRLEQRVRMVSTTSRKGTSSVAVCVAGQARTIVHPSVARLMRARVLDNGRHDLFAVLSTGSHGNALPVGSRFARNVSMQSIDDQCLPEACELAAALQHLRPLRTRFVLNSHEGREPCRENFATIQMVATASCVNIVESYERDQNFRVRYRFMLRTRPDVYWKASLPLDDLTSKLGHRRMVLTTNDWHMLVHRGLWTVLRSMDNVTCDQRCNGRRAHYLGTIFDEMNEYCAPALLHSPTLPACYYLDMCV